MNSKLKKILSAALAVLIFLNSVGFNTFAVTGDTLDFNDFCDIPDDDIPADQAESSLLFEGDSEEIPSVPLQNYTVVNGTPSLSPYTEKNITISGATGLGINKYSYTFPASYIFYNPVYNDPIDGKEYIVVSSKKQLQWVNSNAKDIKVRGTSAQVVFRWEKSLLGGDWVFERAEILDNGDMFDLTQVNIPTVDIASGTPSQANPVVEKSSPSQAVLPVEKSSPSQATPPVGKGTPSQATSPEEGNLTEATVQPKAETPHIMLTEDQKKEDGVDKLFVTVNIIYENKSYSYHENYMIVNDIDMQSSNWIPWNYTGQCIKGKVLQTDGVVRNPVISNLSVIEGSDTKFGVGFFGALCSPAAVKDVEKGTENERPWWDIIGNLLGGLVDLVGGLLKLVGGLVTDLVGLITGWTDITTWDTQPVQVEGLTLSNVTLVTDGFFEKKNGNDRIKAEMPVGTFAGQISGDVTVKNCHVINATSIAGEKWVGGFVGKSVGATNYLLKGTTSGLQGVLEGLGTILDSLTNILLPTDDLIGNLIEGLGADKLIPTKYIPVHLEYCGITYSNGTVIGNHDYVGGFAGLLQGTQATDCYVQGIEDVTGRSNIGGFAGRISNAFLVGLLQGLGVNLVNFPVGSTITDCVLVGNGLTVRSTYTDKNELTGVEEALSYAGGFTGAVMASNVVYSGIDGKFCGVTSGLARVEANGQYVGGFTGYAGIGDLAQALNLLDKALNLQAKGDGSVEIPLGTGLTKLLNTVLGVNLNQGILSLMGIKSSQLVGCRVVGVESGYIVNSVGGDRVGGFVGFLHGGRVAEKLVEFSYERVQATDANGTPIFVDANSISEEKGGIFNKKKVLRGGVYARTKPDGTIAYEDVHGQPVTVTLHHPDNNNTIYHIYDNVFIDLGDKNKPKTISSFRDEKWKSILYTSGEEAGNPIVVIEDLPGYTNGLAFPVYVQKTDAEGRVQFTYKYAGKNEQNEDTMLEMPLWRDNDGRYWQEDGTEFTGVDAQLLSVDALEVSIEEDKTETENGGAVVTYIHNLGSVSGQDFVGGVVGQAKLASAVGQAKLASAVDLLSNLTIAQYERFEMNNIRVDGDFTVFANGDRSGGAVGYAMGGDIVGVEIKGVSKVSAKRYAGGFAGQIVPGTVAGEGGSGLTLLGLISVNNLLSVIDAVHTFVNDSSVTGGESGLTVNAQNTDRNSVAGGFVGWSVNTHYSNCFVSRLSKAEGDTYAGGFVAVADTGSMAGVLDNTFGSLDIGQLLGLNKLVSLLEVFTNDCNACFVNTQSNEIPYTVSAASFVPVDGSGLRINAQNRRGAMDQSAGSAGGFIGYGTAVQIDGCANENLQMVDATSYAGGFGGFINIGSVAQLGNAGILGKIASLTGIATLLDCTVSMVLSSYCQGTGGGYSVRAQDRTEDILGWKDIGIAGGFIGNLEGSHVEGSYANHIDKVIGKEYAGGFIGNFVPGDITRAAENTNILEGLIQIEGGLLGALQTMVPSIKNSYAKCVPCGGTVEAMGMTYTNLTGILEKIGVAGGYVGQNAGGQIWGNETSLIRKVYRKVGEVWSWVDIYPRTVETREVKTGDYSGNAPGKESEVYGTGQTCDILQLAKVDATHFAGGYSGDTVAAQLAAVGDIDLLGGLIPLGDLLRLGQVVVPTQRYTGVTGPLRNVTQAQMDYLNRENQAQGSSADFSKYYGYTVGNEETTNAGGYTGVMTTGIISDSVGFDLLSVEGIENAGGFAGAMLTGGVVQGDIKNSLLGGLIDGVTSSTENLLGIAKAIVPVVKRSGMNGYYSGCKITASNGSAGGFVGTVRGGQIWGEADATEIQKPVIVPIPTYAERTKHCYINNLRSVRAEGSTADAGGFVGYAGASSVASLGGLGLLKLIELPANFISLLSVTVPTIYYADVNAVDSWGFRVLADKGRSAGGFAGYLQGVQIGVKDKITGFQTGDKNAPETEDANILVQGLRTVCAGDYAGGFFGYADASDTLNVQSENQNNSSEKFTLLSLLSLGNISALELAKSYIYNSRVSGIAEGYTVVANGAYEWKTAEWDEDKNKAACAGGFGGLLKSGVIRFSVGENLSTVQGKNYVGGFVGKMSKTSIIKINETSTTDQLGFLGGLINNLKLGVGDVFGSHIRDSGIWGTEKGYSVLSNQGYHNIAGGFVGYADVCRISDSHAHNLRTVSSKEIAGGFMGAMSDSTLLNLNVGVLEKLLDVVVSVDLLKVNRSKMENISVTGVADWDGYDVYGGGASKTNDPQNLAGYTGSFIGLNMGSTITNGLAKYADTVKGTLQYTQPYIGTAENTALLTNLEINVLKLLPKLEGWLSKSEISADSTFETIIGSTPTPEGAVKQLHLAKTEMISLPINHQVSAYEADLMIREVVNSLSIKKELNYVNGAIPNIQDAQHTFEIQLWKDNMQLKTAYLRPGDRIVYENLTPGTYVIKENPDSVLPGSITAASPITVTVTAGGKTKVVVENTVEGSEQHLRQDNPTGKNAAVHKRQVINHIPVDDTDPPIIVNPCEVLNEIVDPAAKNSTNESSKTPIEVSEEAAAYEVVMDSRKKEENGGSTDEAS